MRKLGIPQPIIPQQIHNAIAAAKKQKQLNAIAISKAIAAKKQKQLNASILHASILPKKLPNESNPNMTKGMLYSKSKQQLLKKYNAPVIIPPLKPIILPNKHTNAPPDLPNERELPNNARRALIIRLEEGLDRAHSQHKKYNYKKSLDKRITEIDNEIKLMLDYQKRYKIEKEDRNKYEGILRNATADTQTITNARNKIELLTKREIDGWIPYFKTYDATIQNFKKYDATIQYLRNIRDELNIQQQKFIEQRIINNTRISSMKKGGGHYHYGILMRMPINHLPQQAAMFLV